MSIRRFNLLIFSAAATLQLILFAGAIWWAVENDKKEVHRAVNTMLHAIYERYRDELIANEMLGHVGLQQRLLKSIAESYQINIEVVRGEDRHAATTSQEGLGLSYPLEYADILFGEVRLSKEHEHIASKFGYIILIIGGLQLATLLMLALVFSSYIILTLKPIIQISTNGSAEKIGSRFDRLIPDEIMVLIRKLIASKEEEKTNARNAAIARTMQMLAHDIRKPFTMLKAMCSILAKYPENKVGHLSKDLLPEIQNSLNSVNNMISDVMEIGAIVKPIVANVSLKQLISNVLIEQFRYGNKTDISFEFLMTHSSMVEVDEYKIGRVFSNIVSNALDATKGRGVIRFESTQDGDKIQVTIINSGSPIPLAIAREIFNAFYTNKSGGTGLGLTICQKILEAHGCRIWYSENSNRAAFNFTLPIASVQDNVQIDFPISSKEIRTSLLANDLASDALASKAALLEQKLEQDVLAKLISRIRLLICEDEKVYTNLLLQYFDLSPRLKEMVEIYVTSNADDAIGMFEKFNPDVVIMDVDLGGGTDGFSTVQKMRAIGKRSKICIHSNRGTMDYQQKAIDSGANLFLPKPMTRSHLLHIILGSC